MATPVIEINMDRKCERCGKPGAAQGGVCLSCVTKIMDEKWRGETMKIGPAVIKRSIEVLGKILDTYQNGIDEAYCKTEDKFAVGLRLIFSPERGGVHVEGEIAYTPEKVRDSLDGGIVSEEQMPLFEDQQAA